MSDRVRLFIDYQNAYRSARDHYHDRLDPSWAGQFHPGDLGRLLVERSPYPRTLEGVKVYRGLPSAKHDPKAYGAARAQIAAWERDQLVSVTSRPLRYPPDWPSTKAQEKGVDVALAMDFVMGAVKGSYDVGVMMTLDTDVKPALETVLDQLHGIRVEVVAWNHPESRSGRLSLPGRKIWCHWVQEEAEYRSGADQTDYVRR